MDRQLDLNYFNLDDFIQLISTGNISINNNIELFDNKDNKNTVSIISHLLFLCKENNTDILSILNIIKKSIEEFIQNLMNNGTIKSYTLKIIKQWNLDINYTDIFNSNIEDITDINYNDFIKLDTEFNQIDQTFTNLEEIIVNKQYVIDSDIKDNIILLNTNCSEFNNDANKYINLLTSTISKYDPKYLYLLLDLSMKNKNDYINNFKKANSTQNHYFNNLVSETNIHTIPDNINIIYLNYIYIINMFKKELNYLLTTIHNEHKHNNNKLNILETVMEGLII